MRIAAIVSSLVVLVLPALAGADRGRGSLEIVDGRGVVHVKGRGVMLGRLDRGQLTIADLSPNDQWSPRVNGVPRGRLVSLRGRDIRFYVPAGRYRIVVRGEGINISARGVGAAVLDGEADPTGAMGSFQVGDDLPQALPDDPTQVPFGAGTADQSLRRAP